MDLGDLIKQSMNSVGKAFILRGDDWGIIFKEEVFLWLQFSSSRSPSNCDMKKQKLKSWDAQYIQTNRAGN